jgi:alpha-D-ribose 1-methylphosphonate 5-triphosphate synthase subunit PhnL
MKNLRKIDEFRCHKPSSRELQNSKELSVPQNAGNCVTSRGKSAVSRETLVRGFIQFRSCEIHNCKIVSSKGSKGKGKAHPITGHECPEGE